MINTNKHITFNSLTFFAAGANNRGVRATARMSNGFSIEVYGGFNDTSDGASRFDARVVNSNGETCRVPGYPPVLRAASPDDITGLLMQAQTRARPRVNTQPKTNTHA